MNEEEYDNMQQKLGKIKEILQIEDDNKQLQEIKDLDEETTELLIDKIQARMQELEENQQ